MLAFLMFFTDLQKMRVPSRLSTSTRKPESCASRISPWRSASARGNRSSRSGEKLADDLECDFKLLADVKKLPYDIVVNTTPVGMTPHDDCMPVKPELVAAGTVVMDMVYNPLKTRLLKEAKKTGCHTIEGVSMLVHQGAVQFELWTGQKAPVDVMRKAVMDELSDQ